MPFKSKAQAKFMYANHPDIAKEWASKTKSVKALPNHVKGSAYPKSVQMGIIKGSPVKKPSGMEDVGLSSKALHIHRIAKGKKANS